MDLAIGDVDPVVVGKTGIAALPSCDAATTIAQLNVA